MATRGLKKMRGDNAEFEEEEQAGAEEEAPFKEKRGSVHSLSTKNPNSKPGRGTVAVETGLPPDRLKGYRKGMSRTRFTGADARAALIGEYGAKRKRPGGFSGGEKFKGSHDKDLY